MRGRIIKKKNIKIKATITYVVLFILILLFLPSTIDLFNKSLFAFREERTHEEKLNEIITENNLKEENIERFNNLFEREKELRKRGLYERNNEGVIVIYEEDKLIEENRGMYFDTKDSPFFEISF